MGFKGRWTEIAQAGMAAGALIKHHDILKDGLAFLATKADAVIVPAAVNTKGWWQRILTFRFVRADVKFGKPFRFKMPEGGALTKGVCEQMMREAMYQLALTIPDEYAQEYRGVYQDVEKATTEMIEFLSSNDQHDTA